MIAQSTFPLQKRNPFRKQREKAIKKGCRIRGRRSFDPAFAFIFSMERFQEYQEATQKGNAEGFQNRLKQRIKEKCGNHMRSGCRL